jgi:hypothetical protein
MLSSRKTYPLKPLALVVAAAAIAVPTAQAHHSLGGSDGRLDPWASNVVRRSAQPLPLDPPFAAAVRQHARREAGPAERLDASTPMATAGGFDWGAAAIGAAVSLVATVLTMTGMTVVLRRRPVRPALD